MSATFTRPGITAETLASAGIREVSEHQAMDLIGMAAAGIAIPYHDIGDRPLMVNEKPFHRVRLNQSLGKAKYLSPKGSGAQLYIPLNQTPGSSTLVICEGEFKALSLSESGILAVGLGGITSALSDGKLIPALADCIKVWNITEVAFLGDADTSMIFDFSREAVKIRAALPKGVSLSLPRVAFTDPKGIDDCKEAKAGGFNAWFNGIMQGAVQVSEKISDSSLAIKLLAPDIKEITSDFSEHKARLMKLARRLQPMELDALARWVKQHQGCPTGTFKKEVEGSKDDAGDEPLEIPEMYFDGSRYYRPRRGSYDAIIREDAFLELRSRGFSDSCERGELMSPADRAAHVIQTSNRVHYAGAICGRPVGVHKEGDIMVLATSGPSIIEGKVGDPSPVEDFIADLLGRGQDEFALTQLHTFAGWLKHFRSALRNHEKHQPGQALALVGPPNCGKSLLQSIITLCAGGRGQDASLYLLGDSVFNKELWGAEHLFLDDDKLGDNGRESHAVRDRLKKLTVANVFNMHAKGKDAVGFRPIWRTTISANLDDESINVLPPPDESFGDKIIYLKCYPPARPFHDGSDEGRARFWESLTGALPAFLDDVDSFEAPEDRRASRFYVREFHHPDVLEAINGASPEGPLGELIDQWLSDRREVEPIEKEASELFQMLRDANPYTLSGYTKSPRHLGHQLSRLSRLPRWKGRIEKRPRRIGGREMNQQVNFWRITPLRSNAE